MGYRPEPKVYRITLADGEHAGLSMRVRSVPVGRFLDLTRMADRATGSPREAMTDMEGLFAGFAEALIEWNLEDPDTGDPVPPDLAGLSVLDFDLGMLLIGEWLTAIGGVAAPLGAPRPSGATMPEESIPMEPLSPSLAS
jgi:hypothetical protein